METNAYMRTLIRKRNRERNEEFMLLMAVRHKSQRSLKLLNKAVRELEEDLLYANGVAGLLDKAFTWRITLQGQDHWEAIFDWLAASIPHRDHLQGPHVLAELTRARDVLKAGIKKGLDKESDGGFFEK